MRNPDAVGNLFESRDRKDRRYNAGGKLIESKTAFYSYDEEGFLIEKKEKSGKVWKYEWNTAGMLQRVVRPDKAEVHFKYDALGRRLEKQYKKTITKFIWDGNKPLHEWKEFDAKEATADEIITWVFNEDDFAPTAKIKGEKKYSIVTDHLGTPVQGYNETGELIWDRELDSYGKIRMLKGDEGFCNYLYQGQTLDAETGLAYNKFRYYDCEGGIYISQDPIGIAGSNPNLYAYVQDPNVWLDVFGLDCWSTARKKFWKNEAINNPHLYSSNNLARMKDGKAPRMTVEVTNRTTGVTSVKDYSLELHHTTIPQRVGGTGVHNTTNLAKVDPWQHEAIDPYRHVGSDLDVVVKGVDTW